MIWLKARGILSFNSVFSPSKESILAPRSSSPCTYTNNPQLKSQIEKTQRVEVVAYVDILQRGIKGQNFYQQQVVSLLVSRLLCVITNSKEGWGGGGRVKAS